jgi:predicted heme/steroid binding protein
MELFFLQIAGLPLHPLVVHAAVVFIPLASVMILTSIVLYRRFPRLLGFATALTWVAALSAFVATQSGEALAGEIGITQVHEQWGNLMGPLTIAAAVIVTVTWWVRLRGWRVLSLGGTLASVVIAPVLLVMVFLAGHSGAEATWANILAPTSQVVVSSEDPTAVVSPSSEIPAPNSSQETGDAESFTLDDVAAHATIDDCWIVVDGMVYDASGYAAEHPGGASRIANICGTDATEAFRNQHGNQGSPNRTLAGFELGPLKN